MANFKEFRTLLQKHFDEMVKDGAPLFITNADEDKLYNLYLDSFPAGTNSTFRKRREYDCSCCRRFVKNIGKLVSFMDGQMVTVWDFDTKSDVYQPVVDALAAYVKTCAVVNPYYVSRNMISDGKFGTEMNYEYDADHKAVRTWDHFAVEIPQRFIVNSYDVSTKMAEWRDSANVFKRSLEELTMDAVDTVLELIAQNSLYRGKEFEGLVRGFKSDKQVYYRLPDEKKSAYVWMAPGGASMNRLRIRNTAIGTLLVNLSEGMDVDAAVTAFEKVVAPANYKRPKAIFTKKMLEDAQKTVTELGYMNSLARRFATLDDITANNILFCNRDAAPRVMGAANPFEAMAKSLGTDPKKFGRAEEIGIEKFVKEVLPTAAGLELFMENRFSKNMVSLIAPQDKSAPSMFKWSNGFSWAYTGNIADSDIRENVKAAGGKVDGVLRFSIQWNDVPGEWDENDEDAHCIEPDKNHIYFGNKWHPRTDGCLDVDITHPSRDKAAVENITWPDIKKMKEGEYSFYVNCFASRGGKTGFRAEIEFDGNIYSFNYDKPLHGGQNVAVAKVTLKDGKFSIKEQLPSSTSTREIWGVNSNQFVPVSVAMYSPNYWDEQTGNGNRHYFFMLKDCVNPEKPNGFYNEFLKTDLLQHKRVFEALGSQMAVQSVDDQLSGVGFSETQHNSFIVKVQGATERVLKVVI
ncbi:hypothetical protein CGS57_02005 [Faecalibacterium prausnitzii]|nr:hypothetical protein CGS53_01720 [Faecalibacterium prausnitzii]PDX79187.1 hypothetical protein CGS57_02005 [Faecalibacterium prausnitzii]